MSTGEFWLYSTSPTQAPTEIWKSYETGNRGRSTRKDLKLKERHPECFCLLGRSTA
jgi:hypothetical protein